MRRASPPRQRGATLFVVMVMVLLVTLLVLWSSRSAYLSELVTGNDSDYQRALEAAHAMVRDAELDIQNQRPDGTACTRDPQANCRTWGRLDAASRQAFYPEQESELHDVTARLRALTPPCSGGICAAITDDTPGNTEAPTPEFWTEPARLESMQSQGARYGEFTGARSGEVGNPLLVWSADDAKAWYWVELLAYNPASAFQGSASHTFAPDATTPQVYRITAIAQGVKRGTQAVVQTLFVWKKVDS